MKESQIQKALITDHKFRGVKGTKLVGIINEGTDRANLFMRMELVARGLWAGFPDLIVLGPEAGRVRFLELKTEDGALSPEQRRCHAELGALGFEVRVAKGLQAALSVLEDYGVLRPDLNAKPLQAAE